MTTQIPIKISVISNPDKIARNLLQNYTGDEPKGELLEPGYYNYVKDIEATDFLITLYLSHLFSQHSDVKSRMKYYRGAIGVIFIFDMIYDSSYLASKKLYYEIHQNEAFSEYQMIFLELFEKNRDYNSSKIQNFSKKEKINYYQIHKDDLQSFDRIIRSIVSNSSYFQAMTQGSCDLSLG